MDAEVRTPRLILVRVALVMLGVAVTSSAACSEGDDSPSAASLTTAEADDVDGSSVNGSDAEELAPGTRLTRETEVAVRLCVRSHQLLGAALANGESAAYDTTVEACDQAAVQLEVDGEGVRGSTPANDLALLLSERMFDASLVQVACVAADGGCSSDADELDESFQEWSAEVDEILGDTGES